MGAIEITFACGHVGRVGDLGRLCVSCVAETYAAKDAEIARLTAELAEAKERERVLREAVEDAPVYNCCCVFASSPGEDEVRHPEYCDCWKRAALGEP